MSSIHDVAKMAGVSTATVSKCLNRSAYVGASKREAIERAAAELGYTPNRAARQLKTQSSREILFIVPNMNEKLYREIMIGISAVLDSEYRLVIQLTGDIPERENVILHECLNNPCAGIFLCSCCPDNSDLLDKLNSKIPLIFILRKPKDSHNYSFLCFNQSDAIYSLTTELLNLGYDDIALYTDDTVFSCEAECIDAFQMAFHHQDKILATNRVFSIPFSREAIFRSIMKLLDSDNYPPVFITTSYAQANAINEVAYFRNLELGRDILLFALGEDSWYNSMFINRIICTFRDAQRLGTTAAGVLKARITAPSVFENVNLSLEDGFRYSMIGDYIAKLRNNAPPKITSELKKKLRIAFNETDSGTDALKSLVPQFIKQEGVDVEFCPIAHHELHDTLVDMAERKTAEYDLFSFDAPWLPYLDSKSLLYDLTELISNTDIPTNMAPHVLEDIGSLNGRILGLPYTYTLSLLFYRKDLFNDPEICEQFYKQHKVKLAPPNNWNMFNIIAGFFTRSMNEHSPTLYGTSIFGGNFAAALCIELFPRMWAYNGVVVDRRGLVRLYSHENYKAYQSLIQTIHCCVPDALSSDAFSGIKQLVNGDTAMCVAYSHNSTPMADSARNPTRDKIGVKPTPNQKTVSAGWSIGVNKYSKNLPHAFNFIKWFSSLELSSAFTILGGVAPLTPLLELEPLKQLYPWNDVVRQEYHTATKREIPSISGVPILDELKTEGILASVLYDYFNNKDSLDALLFKAHHELCRYCEANGYPKNGPVTRLSLGQ